MNISNNIAEKSRKGIIKRWGDSSVKWCSAQGGCLLIVLKEIVIKQAISKRIPWLISGY